MAGNKGVTYLGPGRVEVQDLDYPTFELKEGPGVNPVNVGRKTPHGAVIKTVTTNICGNDQHMVRGRTTAPAGLVLGHEITGEVRLGLGWSKSLAFFTGRCPVMKYNRELMMAIRYDRVSIARNVNATPIPLEQAPEGYQEFDKGASKKYVLDPNGYLGTKAA